MNRTLKFAGLITVLTVFLTSSFAFGKEGPELNSEAALTYVPGDQVTVPIIFFVPDIVILYANGGLTTKKGSIYDQLGLNIKLAWEDDIEKQKKMYPRKTPLLRSTGHQLAMVSDINANESTRARSILWLTSSRGDHLIGTKDIRQIRDLKPRGGKKCTVIMQDKPVNVGLLDDAFQQAGIGWNQVELVLTPDIIGDNGPGAKFRELMEKQKRTRVVALVVTPDMVAITGGLQAIGDGGEGTIPGAHVVVSTNDFQNSVLDKYVVNERFYRTKDGREFIEKFVLGYLMAYEKLVDLRKAYETSGSSDFEDMLDLAITVFGTKNLPNRQEAYLFFTDAVPAGHPGQVAFYTDSENPHNFERYFANAYRFAKARGYITTVHPYLKSDIDYNSNRFTGKLKYTKMVRKAAFRAEVVRAEIEKRREEDSYKDQFIDTFPIYFKENQLTFPEAEYSKQLKGTIEFANQGSGAVITLNACVDHGWLIYNLVMAGKQKGIIQQGATRGGIPEFTLNGQLLDFSKLNDIVKLIESGAFDGAANYNVRAILRKGFEDSQDRGEAVKKALLAYAKDHNLPIDKSQIYVVALGPTYPFLLRPPKGQEWKNMRVEVAITRVSSEGKVPSDFTF